MTFLIFGLPLLISLALLKKHKLECVGRRTLAILICAGVVLPWVDVAETELFIARWGSIVEANPIMRVLHAFPPVISWLFNIGLHILACYIVFALGRDLRRNPNSLDLSTLIVINGILTAVVTLNTVQLFMFF